ncbi:hypothetical protein BKA66DRAFT_459900 [Pyrenochaeta sp. MPI-SDFR-AT-0127]|nr:hypothetical protein BKA66DRAFT_459900 [Pyrenochaeta sp. MPI-SDFR-AT-0127]
MTGHTGGKERKLSASGGPYAQVKTTSGEPYTTLAQPGSIIAQGKVDHVGPDGYTSGTTTTSGTHIGDSKTTSAGHHGSSAATGPLGSSDTTSRGHVDSSTATSGGLVSGSTTTSGRHFGDSTTATGGPLGSSNTTSGENLRPEATPTGTGSANTGFSAASIKSGVIGFGAGEQGHAALPARRSAEHGLDRNQVVGGGILGAGAGTGAAAAQRDARLDTESQALPHTTTTGHSDPAGPHDSKLLNKADPRFDSDRYGASSNTGIIGTGTQQPAGKSLGHESHTTHTDRSFPLTGTSEREPGTKDREVGSRDGYGREGLAGAAAAATALGVSKTLGHSDEKDVKNQGLETRQATYGDVPGASSQTGPSSTGILGSSTTGTTGHSDPTGPHDSRLANKADPRVDSDRYGASGNTSGLTGGPATGILGGATTGTAGHSDPTGPHDSRLANKADPRVDSDRYGASGNASGVTGGPTTGTTQYHPDALAAATAAAAAAASKSSTSTGAPVSGTHDRSLPGASSTGGTATSTSVPLDATPHTLERPHGHKSDLYRHIPGEFPSPTPGDESKTFLDYRPVTEDIPGTNTTGTTASGLAPGLTSGTDTTTGQHELRHTGSLDQPASKSSDPSEHHYGRDAAIVGGLGAGAAGLGYAASQNRDTSDASSKPLYEESSPYSSKTLDPRVLGTKANLEEQRFDPQAKTETSSHLAQQTSGPSGLSTATGATTSHGTAKADSSEHHHGRDAALVGAGAATGAAAAGGVRQTLARNDTPGTGTFVLPQETSSASAPLSSSTAPQHHSAGNETFYGTPGAPAPIADKSSTQQPLGNLGHTSDPATSATSTAPSHVPERDNQHHLGRDAALAGAGAATAGGLYAASRDDKTNTGPASKTIGPHDSNVANVLDPRVQPDPSRQAHHNIGSTSQDPASRTVGQHDNNVANVVDPTVSQNAGQQGEHHYGRDTAVAGGTGAAGYGAYEAAKAYGEHRSTQPGASMNDQRYDTTTTGANAPNPVPTKGHYDYSDPSTASNANRNTALGTGAVLGTGGVGAAAYAGSKHADNSQNIPLHQKQDFATSGQPGSVTQAGPTQGTIAPRNTLAQDPTHQQHYNATQDPSEQRHDKRDAALLGTAGAVAAGGAAYGYSQHQDERERARLQEREQERLKKEAHDREKEQHKFGKEQHKHDKETHKLEKEQHKHDKEVAAAQHKHDKDVAAHGKEQHRLEKEARRHDEEGEKKKGGLLGFLHRDKSKKEKSTSPESSPRHSKEYAAAGTAGAVGAGTAAAAYSDDSDPNSPRWKGKNRLHKDPPKGHPARESLEHQREGSGEFAGGKREHIGVDGPIGHPDLISGDKETKKGVYGAHEISNAGIVTDPITSLPVNVGKYGSGTGGTDGYQAIAGHHDLPGSTGTGAAPGAGHHTLPGTAGTHTGPATGTGTGYGTSTAPGGFGNQTTSGANLDSSRRTDTPY